MDNDFIIGNTFGFSGPLKKADGTPFDLTGCTLAAEIFKANGTYGVEAKLSDITVVAVGSPTLGILSMSALPAVTLTWVAGGARVRLTVTSASGVKTSADSNKFALRA